jgi:cytidine deaminase
MKQSQHVINFDEYNSIDDLNASDAALLKQARETADDAYAPYSNFRVGAAALLGDGKIVTGTNQENASYPVGICAERVLLSAVASQHKNIPISTIAISYHHLDGVSDHPVAPCGMCRQSLVEFEMRMKQPIRLILSGLEGKVVVVPEANDLLPLAFNKSELDKK